MIKKICCCFLLLFALLILPFILRQNDFAAIKQNKKTDRLVIVTAHNKSIRDEYAVAFNRYYLKRFNRNVILDFRTPGGTSDIVRFIADRFEAEFRQYCQAKKIPWNSEAVTEFTNPHSASMYRKIFLSSDVGIDIDLFAGGGTFDQSKMAAAGFAVDGGLQTRHPEYFLHDSIPNEFSGEQLYDPQGRYYGVVLSTFGLCYNVDRIAELTDKRPPVRWSDLADPKYFNKIVLADPSKSGSANKCFEIILQQEMAKAGGPERGWINGLNLIKRLFANTRNVTDSAGKVVRDVGNGDATAGTAIDTYGFAEASWSALRFDGKSKVVYVTPQGGTAVGTDPIQMLRGAPNRKVAEAFLDWILSIEGQKLHTFKAGVPGGPVKNSLNRTAIRKELYHEKYHNLRFEPNYLPYKSGADFIYRPEWTGRYYSLLRVLLKSICLDPQPELQAAWRAIIAAGGPQHVPEAMKAFDALPFNYLEAGKAVQLLRAGNGRKPSDVVATRREWSDFARKQYIKAEQLAKSGK